MPNMPSWTASAAAASVLGWTNSRGPNIPTPSTGSRYLLSLEHAGRSRIGAGSSGEGRRWRRLHLKPKPTRTPQQQLGDWQHRLCSIERVEHLCLLHNHRCPRPGGVMSMSSGVGGPSVLTDLLLLVADSQASASTTGDIASYQRSSSFVDVGFIVFAYWTSMCKAKLERFKDTYPEDLLTLVLKTKRTEMFLMLS